MNGIPLLLLILNAIMLLLVPRRWAPLPLLLGACYLTLSSMIVVGFIHLPAIRILIIIGIARIIIRKERILGGLNSLDYSVLIFSAWTIFASFFISNLVGLSGYVLNTLGIYILIRTFCTTQDDQCHLISIIALVFFLLALEMIGEKVFARNLFSLLNGQSGNVIFRGGHIRAQGPFAHPILAGTIGASCMPMMLGLYKIRPRPAIVGILSCFLMIATCASSGPILGFLAGLAAFLFWRWRTTTRLLKIAFIALYIILDLVMEAPAYYIIARIDLTGNSTGWHRAEIIRAAISHFEEWWLFGTNYTRHWMPYGVTWSQDHSDITNQYIGYGVTGGFLRMFLFISALFIAFGYVGRYVRNPKTSTIQSKLAWSLGAALFSHALSCTSVAYFDQSVLFIFINLALIGSLPFLQETTPTQFPSTQNPSQVS